MMQEISVHARPTNKKANTFVYTCFATALILLILSAIIGKYRGIFGMAILIILTAAILLYTKYIATRYIYDLTTDENGLPVLIARSITGKRQTTLMRIDMYSVKSVERLSGESIRGYRAEAGALKYVYSPTFLPEELILIKSRSRFEKADILIEAPREFEDLIREAAEYAAIIHTDEED